MVNVIATSSRESRNGGAATPARSADCCVIQISHIERGLPRTANEWTALVKIASGELNIPASHRARLVELGLLEPRSGLPALTQHGRLTLGLPE